MAGPRAIGSVFPLPEQAAISVADSLWGRWTEGWAHVAAYRTARAALRALLAAERCRRLWLPAYVCDVLARAVPPECEIVFYNHGPGLPLAGLDPTAGDAVLGVDYFGRPPSPSEGEGPGMRVGAQDLAKSDGGASPNPSTQSQREHPLSRPLPHRGGEEILWIEDRAQALDTGCPPWGDVVLYSPRKLLGVGDGGLMVSNRSLPQPVTSASDDEALTTPHHARTLDPEGAHPERWSPAFQAREAAFTAEPLAMNPDTIATLKATAAAPLITQRKVNYARLAAALPDFALWPAPEPDFAPLALPILVDDAASAVRALAAQRIYCARHWAELPSPKAAFPQAHALAARLVSLPCDQSYGAADMDRVGEVVRRLLSPAGSR